MSVGLTTEKIAAPSTNSDITRFNARVMQALSMGEISQLIIQLIEKVD